MKQNPVVHFEIPAQDRARMCEFYTKTFGWETNQLGPEMNHYVIAMTTESDKNGPLKPGAINGGFYTVTPDMPPQHPSLVISVDNIEEHMKKVVAAGGSIQGGPMAIPGVGLIVTFTDTEGNRLSMLQPKM